MLVTHNLVFSSMFLEVSLREVRVLDEHLLDRLQQQTHNIAQFGDLGF